MITHRPVMGSFLNSGNASSWAKKQLSWKSDSTRNSGFILLFPARLQTQGGNVRFQSSSKGTFVQAHHGMLPGRRLNRQDIESERRASGAVFAEELPCDSRKMPLLLEGDRFFGGAELASHRGSRLHLDKRDRLAVVSHQVDFALHPAISKVSRDHHVSLAPQIPIRVRLATNSGSTRPLLRRFPRRRRGRIRQPLTCGPVHQPKHCARKNRHGVFLSYTALHASRQCGFLPGLLRDLCALCVESFARTAMRLLTQRAQRTQRVTDRSRSSHYADDPTSRMHSSRIRAAKSACSSSIINGGATRIVFSPAPSNSRPFSNARSTMASRKSCARSFVF